MVKQQTMLYLEVPTGVPVPGKTMKRVESELDLEGVQIDGGIIVKAKAFSWDPYQVNISGVKHPSKPEPLTSVRP